MKNILNIVSSINGKESNSVKLSDMIINRILEEYPGSKVVTHDIANRPFPHLEETYITSFGTPAEDRTEEGIAALAHSDAAIKEVMDADIIVIGVPYYNFSIPSTLKSWIDHVVRAGVTFNYENGVPTGHVKGKKVYLSFASGAVFSEGPYKQMDFAEPYLKTVLGFIGMTDITSFRIEGIKMPRVAEHAWEKVGTTVEAYPFA
jgi:FMN-dependent NADH-azoreductase